MSNPDKISGKDILDYTKYRIRHLKLEKEKVPFVIKPELRERVIKKLNAKIFELSQLRTFICNRDFNNIINYEKDKGDYLESEKIKHLRGIFLKQRENHSEREAQNLNCSKNHADELVGLIQQTSLRAEGKTSPHTIKEDVSKEVKGE